MSKVGFDIWWDDIMKGSGGRMKLERIKLENFRNYQKSVFHFKQTNVIVAPNGSGKSNLLEAIYLLAVGTSDRARVIEEMVAWNSDLGSVSGIVEERGERQELAVVLTRGTYMGRRTPKRRYLVDGVGRTKATYVGRLAATLFRPEDMRLLEGSPSRRRAYLDEAIGLAYPEYVRAQATYEATLKRRNSLLDLIREGRARRVELAYWDQSLIKNGEILSQYRTRYIDYLNDKVGVPFGKYRVEYRGSAVSSARLSQYAEAEVLAGYTLVGPHKDDFVVEGTKYRVSSNYDNFVNLITYGSRGEQRLGVLFLKIGAMTYLEKVRGVAALLLLDDIFSELDHVHRVEVVKLMQGRQVIMTSAEDEILKYFGGEVSKIRL